ASATTATSAMSVSFSRDATASVPGGGATAAAISLPRFGPPLLVQRGRPRHHLGGDAGRLVRSRHAEPLVEPALHVGEHLRVQFEEIASVLAPLADALAAVAEPGAALFDDVVLHRQVQQ